MRRDRDPKIGGGRTPVATRVGPARDPGRLGGASAIEGVERPSTFRRRRGTHAWLTALAFLSPGLIGLIVLKLGPILTALVLSFSNWDVVGAISFIGLSNYRSLLTDTAFWMSLRTTMLLGIGVVLLDSVFGLALALLLNKKLWGIGIFRAIYLIPLVTTWVAVALVWNYLYSEAGPIDSILAGLRLPPIPWLSTPEWALPAVILTISWKNVGWNMLIYLAGLQSIPIEVYEASSIDGASTFGKFFRITLPLLTPSLFFSLIVGVIEVFQVFDPVYIMTQGGPAGATQTIGYYIYTTGFQRLNMGYASALSWALFIIVIAFTLLQWRLQRRWVFYD